MSTENAPHSDSRDDKSGSSKKYPVPDSDPKGPAITPTWWNRPGQIAVISAIIAAIAPVTTGVKGFFEVRVQQEKNLFDMREHYLDKAIDQELGAEERERLFEFLVAVFEDDPLQVWAEQQLSDAKEEAELLRIRNERDSIAHELSETLLRDAETQVVAYFTKAERQLDALWRISSRKDGIVSRALASVGPNGSDEKQLELIGRLNSIFVPFLQDNSLVSSIVIVNDAGFEYVLLHEDVYDSQVPEYAPYEWRNRVIRVESWEQRAIEQYWEDREALRPKGHMHDIPNLTEFLGTLNVDGEAVDYDPRNRRYARTWLDKSYDPETFDRYWSEGYGAIHWTPPYVFYTTKTVGITASRGWILSGEASQRYVMVVDFTLTELSLETTKLGIGNDGVSFVFTESGAIIGLPKHKSFGSESAILDFFRSVMSEKGLRQSDNEPQLLSVGEMAERLEAEELNRAYLAWDLQGRQEGTIEFDVKNEPWLGRFKKYRFPKGDRTVWICAIAPISQLHREIIRTTA